MKGIIASTLHRNCGVGQYTEKLAQHLQHKVGDLQVFRKDHSDEKLFFTYPYRSLRSLQHHVAPYFLSKKIKNLEADIWHADYLGASYGMELAHIKQPKVVTVHDAIPFHYPGSKLDFAIYKFQLKEAIRNAKSLLVVSEAARQDLIQQTGVAPHRVIAIPNGLPFDELSTHSKENEKFTIRYIGGLGAPHKNVKLLLYAAKILEDRKYNFSLELGGFVPKEFYLKDLAQKLGLTSVQFVGFVPDEEKAQFLGSADLFAYPSLIEGFGFPPMEAMACGTATITTNIPVFQELLGRSVAMVDPMPEAFAMEIESLMKQENLRKDFEFKGLEKVQQYTWEKAAEKTMEVYKAAVR